MPSGEQQLPHGGDAQRERESGPLGGATVAKGAGGDAEHPGLRDGRGRGDGQAEGAGAQRGGPLEQGGPGGFAADHGEVRQAVPPDPCVRERVARDAASALALSAGKSARPQSAADRGGAPPPRAQRAPAAGPARPPHSPPHHQSLLRAQPQKSHHRAPGTQAPFDVQSLVFSSSSLMAPRDSTRLS